MSRYNKVVFLLYCDSKVAKYEILQSDGDTCDIELNLYLPFNRRRAILKDIKVNDVDHAVLDYMSLQAYNDTENCNKMLAFAIVSYFTKQINK